METRERLAGGMRVSRAAKGRPGDCVFVEIDSGWRLVHFVGPIAHFDCGLARCRSEYARNRSAARSRCAEEAMLFMQSLAIAHGTVMALDEDAGIARAATTPAADKGRGLTERMRVGSPSTGNWARSVRNSASVSGGQSGATSVPSMPWALRLRSSLQALSSVVSLQLHPVYCTSLIPSG